MRRIGTTILATAALLALPVGASLAQKPPKPKPPGQVGVTVTANPNPVTFSQPVALKVSVRGAQAGVNVVLQRHLTSSTTFSDLETKATDAKGDVTFTPRPRETTYYRAIARTAPPQTSAELIVKVAPLVGVKASDSTPRSGQRVLFSGTVRPAHDGRRVYLQRKIGGGAFVTVAKTTLRPGTSLYSKYSMRSLVRQTATYRVRILGHTDHSLGISRERVLTTH
jgi:serine protease